MSGRGKGHKASPHLFTPNPVLKLNEDPDVLPVSQTEEVDASELHRRGKERPSFVRVSKDLLDQRQSERPLLLEHMLGSSSEDLDLSRALKLVG